MRNLLTYAGMLVFLLASWGLKGQSFQFLQPGVSGFPQVTEFQDQFTFYFFIHNTSTQSYTGDLRVRMAVNGNAPSTVDSTFVQNFSVGDSLLFVIQNYTVTTASYKLGQNGVVIWIVDDDLLPVTEDDSFDVFIIDRPAFRIGGLGLDGFPTTATWGEQFDFSVHVENLYSEAYFDTLAIEMAVNGTRKVFQSPGKVHLQAYGSTLFPIQGFVIETPPFQAGSNVVAARAVGNANSLSIPNHEQFLDLLGPVSAPAPLEESLRIVPHPVRKDFRIELPRPRRISTLVLRDLRGHVVARYRPASRFSLPEHLPPGPYFLDLTLDNGQRLYRPLWVAPH